MMEIFPLDGHAPVPIHWTGDSLTGCLVGHIGAEHGVSEDVKNALHPVVQEGRGIRTNDWRLLVQSNGALKKP